MEVLENNMVRLRFNRMLVSKELALEIREILDESRKAAAAPPAQASGDRVLKLSQFAALCGLSTQTIRRYVKDGRLKPISPDGPARFLARQIEEFSPSNYPGATGKLRIVQSKHGMNATEFVRRMLLKRRIQTIKAPDRKDPWHR